jgi:hypothetical protein
MEVSDGPEVGELLLFDADAIAILDSGDDIDYVEALGSEILDDPIVR